MSTNEVLELGLHSRLVAHQYYLGTEKAPLLVIDNFVEDPDALIRVAASMPFAPLGRAFPGVRAAAPVVYQQFFAQQLRPLLQEHFAIGDRQLRFSMCHYSLVTTPPERLAMIQRIPHFDSMDSQGLASVHYLFKGNLGGTAFYRHRKTGFEFIDESRQLTYLKSLESENDGPNMPSPSYINGDTPLFEQIARQEGIFNRVLIYRRNSLHSGSIDKDFRPDPNPLTGRLSINSFIDLV